MLKKLPPSIPAAVIAPADQRDHAGRCGVDFDQTTVAAAAAAAAEVGTADAGLSAEAEILDDQLSRLLPAVAGL